MTPDSFNFDKTKPLKPMLALFATGCYGIEHAYRVFKLVEKIAEFEKLEGDQIQILDLNPMRNSERRVFFAKMYLRMT